MLATSRLHQRMNNQAFRIFAITLDIHWSKIFNLLLKKKKKKLFCNKTSLSNLSLTRNTNRPTVCDSDIGSTRN